MPVLVSAKTAKDSAHVKNLFTAKSLHSTSVGLVRLVRLAWRVRRAREAAISYNGVGTPVRVRGGRADRGRAAAGGLWEVLTSRAAITDVMATSWKYI